MAAPNLPIPVPPPAGQQAAEVALPMPALGPLAPFLRPEDFAYTPLDDTPLPQSLAIVGISGIGTAGSLAARYLVEHLGMKLVGAFQSIGLPPVALGHKGLMAGPIQVWSAEVACGPGQECERLLVVRSDLPIEIGIIAPFTTALDRWASENGISLLVGIDSYPREKGKGDAVLVGASAGAQDLAGSTGAKPLDDAIVFGFNASLVANANRERMRALVFYGPRGSPKEDAKAAAAALQAASRLLPPLDLANASEDLERIEGDIEARIKAAMESASGQAGLRGYA